FPRLRPRHLTDQIQSEAGFSQYPPGNIRVTSIGCRFLALLDPSLVGIRSRTGAPDSGARGCPSKSSARIVCGCSALAMSMLVEYPSKHLKLTKGARRSAPIR